MIESVLASNRYANESISDQYQLELELLVHPFIKELTELEFNFSEVYYDPDMPKIFWINAQAKLKGDSTSLTCNFKIHSSQEVYPLGEDEYKNERFPDLGIEDICPGYNNGDINDDKGNFKGLNSTRESIQLAFFHFLCSRREKYPAFEKFYSRHCFHLRQ